MRYAGIRWRCFLQLAHLIAGWSERLPAKKEYQPYVGEWRTISWTKEELANAFESELTWERLQSASINPFVLNVPRTIDEAVRREYKIEVHDPAWLPPLNQISRNAADR